MTWAVWITGLPGSGKSTIALALQKAVPDSVLLNMDSVRQIITPAPTYSEVEREMVYRAVVFTAQLLYELGHNVIIDATGNRRMWRELAAKKIANFFEIYLKTPLALCIQRESSRLDTHRAPRGIYSKGEMGAPVPGLNVPYEEPLNPSLVFDTQALSPEAICGEIVSFLRQSGR
ncbi:MAG TPA: adenylyl-sulfate kinase [Thermodesulfovibrionia bacterium]|nr:adenylyl-sulfate kinase [Thermodesulfovibrionia bacterium]